MSCFRSPGRTTSTEHTSGSGTHVACLTPEYADLEVSRDAAESAADCSAEEAERGEDADGNDSENDRVLRHRLSSLPVREAGVQAYECGHVKPSLSNGCGLAPNHVNPAAVRKKGQTEQRYSTLSDAHAMFDGLRVPSVPCAQT